MFEPIRGWPAHSALANMRVMSARVFACFALLSSLGVPALLKANEPGVSPTVLDLPAFVSELNRWGEVLGRVKGNPGEAAALRRELPPAWSVKVDGQRIEVPTEWLREELAAIEKDPKSAASCDTLQRRLRAMRTEALGIPATPGFSAAEARQKLDAILKRPEFRRVHGPTWLDG